MPVFFAAACGGRLLIALSDLPFPLRGFFRREERFVLQLPRAFERRCRGGVPDPVEARVGIRILAGRGERARQAQRRKAQPEQGVRRVTRSFYRGGRNRAAVFPYIILRHLCCCRSRLFVAERRPVSSPDPCAKSIDSWPSPCECAAPSDRDATPPAREATAWHSARDPRLSSSAFWTRRTSRTSSLDCHPRCFTASFRAADSRIAASSSRWRRPASWRAVFDLDLWRAGQPGLDEQFDADRFGVWLEVLMESGATVAAQKLADDGRRSGDRRRSRSTCSSSIPPRYRPVRRWTEKRRPRITPCTMGSVATIGGYLVVARRTDSWDAIVAVLIVPRRGASRLLPSCDARVPEPLELRIRDRWTGRPAPGDEQVDVRPGVRP